MTTDDETNVVEDDWGLALDFNVFCSFEVHTVTLHPTAALQLECVDSLTPLDMTQLSTGEHDATGQCLWQGAFFFLECLDRLLWELQGERWLELGAGPGLAGLAVAQRGKRVCWTDADPQALDLCRRNVKRNGLEGGIVEVLRWGEDVSPCLRKEEPWDVVFATDVLYDIAALPLLLQSAVDLLPKDRGFFVLSHVPRACYSSENPAEELLQDCRNLDDYIVRMTTTTKFPFVLKHRWSPRDLSESQIHAPTLSVKSLEEMEEIGTALFVFERRAPTATATATVATAGARS